MKQAVILLSSLLSLAACSSSGPAEPTSDAGQSDTSTNTPTTETAQSCVDIECPTYACRCKNGSSLNASHCRDGVCDDGMAVCGPLCADKGGVASAEEKPAVDSGTDSGPTCIPSGEPCGDCAAANCCAEATACGGDSACVNATICLATCKDGFAACAEKCNPSTTTKFHTYTQCLEAKGCAPTCSGTL